MTTLADSPLDPGSMPLRKVHAPPRRRFWLSSPSVLLASVLGLGASVGAGQVAAPRLVSSLAGETGDSASYAVRSSADGRFVVFVTQASNLVPGVTDANAASDVVLLDRSSGARTLVTHTSASPLISANGPSYNPAISADGLYVAYDSAATDLVAGAIDSNGSRDVFLWSRLDNTSKLVSHFDADQLVAANGQSTWAYAIDATGAHVAYDSSATNLVTGESDSNGSTDIFLYDRGSGFNSLVSHTFASPTTAGNSLSTFARISEDGNYVIYLTYASDVSGPGVDANGTSDLFRYHRGSWANILVSHTPLGNSGDSWCSSHRISDDGNFVSWVSPSTNYVAGQVDGNGAADAFLWDGSTGTVTLVSHAASSATTTANSVSDYSVLSGDGKWLLFASRATDLVAGVTDVNGSDFDVFLWQRLTGATTLVSHDSASVSTTGNGESTYEWQNPVLSRDGSVALFESSATDLVAGETDLNSAPDLFVWASTPPSTKLASPSMADETTTADGYSAWPALSANGNLVAYETGATDLDPAAEDANGGSDVGLFSVGSPNARYASIRDDGATNEAAGASSLVDTGLHISADGRFAVFASSSPGVVPYQSDSNGNDDVFLWDRQTGVKVLVSHASWNPLQSGNAFSSNPAISADGNWVAFESSSTDLVAGQVGGGIHSDVFLWERATGTITLVSHTPAGPAAAGSSTSRAPSLSSDGSGIAFMSLSTDLVAGQNDLPDPSWDIFEYLRGDASVRLVSHVLAGAATTGNDDSYLPVISDDGAWIAFESSATNLVAGQVDSGGTLDYFLFSAGSGDNRLITHAAGSPASAANAGSSTFSLTLSSGASFVSFASDATNLVAGETDSNGSRDIFLYDRAGDSTQLVSSAAASPTLASNGDSVDSSVSPDGRWVAFSGSGTDLVSGQADVNGSYDIFLFDRLAAVNRLVSHSASSPTAAANDGSVFSAGRGRISRAGRNVVFDSEATDLVAGQIDSASTSDVFVFHAPSGEIELVSSIPSSTVTAGNGDSFNSEISMSGSSVLFASSATDLGSVDLNGIYDGWERDVREIFAAGFEVGDLCGWDVQVPPVGCP